MRSGRIALQSPGLASITALLQQLRGAHDAWSRTAVKPLTPSATCFLSIASALPPARHLGLPPANMSLRPSPRHRSVQRLTFRRWNGQGMATATTDRCSLRRIPRLSCFLASRPEPVVPRARFQSSPDTRSYAECLRKPVFSAIYIADFAVTSTRTAFTLVAERFAPHYVLVSVCLNVLEFVVGCPMNCPEPLPLCARVRPQLP